MDKIEFKELRWPRGLNLDLLSEFLSEEELREIIVENCRGTRVERRVILPSLKCVKKIIFHFLVTKHNGDFDKIMVDLRGNFRTLSELNVSRYQVRQMYLQREREIKKEK